MGMLLSGCSNDERHQAWSKYNSLELRKWQKFVPYAIIVHSRSHTPFCFSSILSAMAAIVDLYINGDAIAQLFERWTPPSIVPMHYLGGEELTKICSKGVRRTQSDLHTLPCISDDAI